MRVAKHLSLLAGVILAGCGGGSGDTGSAPTGGPLGASLGATQTYSNGDPIVLPSTEVNTLRSESDVISLVNDYRVARGLSSLIDTGNVRDVARGHSQHMITHGFFNHVNPEGDTPGGRLSRADIGWSMAGENIAGGYTSAYDAFQAWLASPGHKANIELTSWTHTGVGYTYNVSSTYRHYWTQNFVRP